MLKKTGRFLNEVVVELKKCDWPIKKEKTLPFYERIRELVNSTVVVIVTMLMLGAFVGGVDFLLSRGIQYILK